MILVDGEDRSQVPGDDRGLQYADGVFETMRAEAGRIALLDSHLTRLECGCRVLGFEAPERRSIQEEIASVLRDEPGPKVVKLLVTRGSGSRGYRAIGRNATRRILYTDDFPAWSPTCWSDGVATRWCVTRLAIGGPLVGIKHLGRAEQVLARNEWVEPAPEEGLMLDAEGHPVCGTMTNLFLVRDGSLVTPALDRCGVAGVARGRIIELAERDSIPTRIDRIWRSEVEDADELFLSNAVVGIWPVRDLAGSQRDVGKVTRRLQHMLDELRPPR